MDVKANTPTEHKTAGCCAKSDGSPVLDRKVSNEESSKCPRFTVLSCLIYNNFWTAACCSLQAPFFPRQAELKGATPTEYGFVFAIFELVIMVTAPVYGKMIAIISPKFLITSGIFLESGACILFGILDQIPAGKIYIGMAFVVRIVEGMGAAAFIIAKFSIVAAEFPDSVGKTFSLMETVFGFGLIVGPTIGGALYEVGGFILPFAVVGGFLLFGTFLLWFWMPNIVTPCLKHPANMREMFLNWDIVLYSLSIVTCMLFIGFNAATLEPHLRGFNLTPTALGTIFIITGGVYALTAPMWGRIIDRGADSLTMIILGYSLTSFGIMFIGPAPFVPFKATECSVIASLLVIGLGMSAKMVASFSGALKSTLSRGFSDDMRTYGMVSAFFSFSFSFGSLIGPALGGLLLDTSGYELGTVFVFSVEVIMMASVITFMLWRKLINSSRRSEKTPFIEDLASNENDAKVSIYSSL